MSEISDDLTVNNVLAVATNVNHVYQENPIKIVNVGEKSVTIEFLVPTDLQKCHEITRSFIQKFHCKVKFCFNGTRISIKGSETE